MLNHSLRKTAYIAVASAFGSAMLVGCVDHDYDLSKDMDLNVTLGGEELNLPVSSTAALTIKDILDLDENDSSIKEAKQGEYGLNEGDYVLVQAPDDGPTTTDVKIAQISINKSGLSTSKNHAELEFPLLDLGWVEVPTTKITTDMSLRDDNVDKQLKSVTEAETDVELKVHVTFDSEDYHGIASILSGTKATFSDSWFLSISDPQTKQFIRVVDNHSIEFTQNKTFHGGSDNGAGFDIILDVVKFDLGPNYGEGLYEPGKFYLESNVDFEGHMAIDNTESKPMQTAKVFLYTETTVESATLHSVTGTVDPEINVDPTIVNITDIPDFLSDKGNNLDIINPQIKLDVLNTSPVSASISAIIEAVYPADSEKAPVEIKIGEKYNKAPITIKGNGKTSICLTQTGEVEGGYTPYIVSELSDMLSKIPEKLEVKNIDVDVDDTTPVKFNLYSTDDPNNLSAIYHFETGYEAVVPFEFGPKMKLNYNTDSDWDVEDMDKYTFGSVVLTMDVINDTPLTLHPDIYAVDEQGNRNNNVTCKFNKDIAGGEKTSLEVELAADDNSLAHVSGIKINFVASTPQEEGLVTRLNAKQNIKLDNIKVSIRDGITVDLND